MFYPPKGRLLADSKGVHLFLLMFYPPEGLCGAEPERGPIVFTLHFIGVGRGTGGFKFTRGERPFRNLENVLSPRRDFAKAEPEWGPFDSLCILLCLRNGFDTCKIPILHRPF